MDMSQHPDQITETGQTTGQSHEKRASADGRNAVTFLLFLAVVAAAWTGAGAAFGLGAIIWGAILLVPVSFVLLVLLTWGN